MSLVVVGSIAFDAVRTPFGERERMLGGSAVHFSLAASFFTDVRVVGPVGDDFGPDEYGVLRDRGINTDDVEHVAGGKTFFWRGHYDFDLNVAHTDDTQLNVFGDFQPKLSAESKACSTLFLANIQPDLQREVRQQSSGASLAGLDSMNLWIETARDSLKAAIGAVDVVLMNDAELRMLTEQPNLLRAAREVMEMGPRMVVAKQGDGRKQLVAYVVPKAWTDPDCLRHTHTLPGGIRIAHQNRNETEYLYEEIFAPRRIRWHR